MSSCIITTGGMFAFLELALITAGIILTHILYGNIIRSLKIIKNKN